MTRSPERQPVVIIGAGLAGLTTAYRLKRKGVKALLLEREMHLGQSWLSRHPQLSLNTHRDLSHLPDLNYPVGIGAFPKRDAVISHLRQFASLHDLTIRYGVEVLKIFKEGGLFTVRTGSGDILADHVVIATGRDAEPDIPRWQGIEQFGKPIVPAARFGQAQRYAGQSVLVVGGGNSGFDVLNHLSRVQTAKIWLSVRGGPTLLPKRLRGFAVHRLSPMLARLPTRLADRLIAVTQRLAFGDLTRLGFPPAVHGAATRLAQNQIAIAVDDGAIVAIRKGRVAIVGGIREFSKDSVVLEDGRVIKPSIVIAATGYGSPLPALVGALGVLDSHGRPAFSGREPQSRMDGLWFTGMTPSLISYFYNADQEGKAIARGIAASRP